MPPLRHARLDRHVPIPEPCRRVDLFDNIDPQPGRIVKPEPALAKGFILQRIGDRRARPGHLRYDAVAYLGDYLILLREFYQRSKTSGAIHSSNIARQ